MPKPVTLFNHYIASSLHVGINVTALVFISSIYLNTIVSIWMYVVAFTATVFGYNTIKYGELASNGFPIRLDRYAWLSYLAAAVGLFALSRISREQQLIFVAVGFLVLFYAFPIQSNKRNIRNQRKIKIYWVACVWSLFTVLFPCPEFIFETQFWVVISHRFLFVLCATLPFEIRDSLSDPKSLRTWPQRFGIATTRSLGVFLSMLAGLMLFFSLLIENIATIITHFILIMLLYKAKPNQSKYYASFWVESLPLFWVSMALMS